MEEPNKKMLFEKQLKERRRRSEEEYRRLVERIKRLEAVPLSQVMRNNMQEDLKMSANVCLLACLHVGSLCGLYVIYTYFSL